MVDALAGGSAGAICDSRWRRLVGHLAPADSLTGLRDFEFVRTRLALGFCIAACVDGAVLFCVFPLV